MPGEKFLQHNNGAFRERVAVQTGGATNAEKIPALDTNGRLDETMMPTGIGADIAVIEASEALSAGDFVNIHDDSGDFRVRKADASSSGKEAHGFVLSAAASGANADIYFEGFNGQVSSADPGVVYLATTAGGFTGTVPSTSGNVVQRLGVAVSATSISFEFTNPIVLA